MKRRLSSTDNGAESNAQSRNRVNSAQPSDLQTGTAPGVSSGGTRVAPGASTIRPASTAEAGASVATAPLFQSRLGLPLPREIDSLILRRCLPGLEEGLSLQRNLARMANLKRVSKGWDLEVTACVHALPTTAKLSLARRMLEIRKDDPAVRKFEQMVPGQLAKSIAVRCALPEPAEKFWEKLAENPALRKWALQHGQLLDPSVIPPLMFTVLAQDFPFWEDYAKSYGNLFHDLTWKLQAVPSAREATREAAKLAQVMSHCKNVRRLCLIRAAAPELRFQPKQWDFMTSLADLRSLDLRSPELPLADFPVEVLQRIEDLRLMLPNEANLKGLEHCTGLKVLEFTHEVQLSEVLTGGARIPPQIQRIHGLTLSADDVPLLPQALQGVTMNPSAAGLSAFIAAFPGLSELTLRGRKLQDRAALLAPVLEASNCVLSELKLRNEGSTTNFGRILQALSANRSLQKFHFAGLRVNRAACAALAAFVRDNPALQDLQLSLHAKNLYIDDIVPLLDALALCSQLKTLDLAFKNGDRALSHCDPEIAERLKAISNDNRSFLQFRWVLAGVEQGHRNDLY